MSRLIAFLCLLLLFLSKCVSADTCMEDSKNKGCVCVLDHKNVDLRSVGHKDGTAAFNVKGDKGATYYYNPCKAFTKKDCKNVAGCQDDNGAFRSIGSQDKATFNTLNGQVYLAYEGGRGGRNMVVNLKCKESQYTAELKYVGEQARNQYSFELTTVCACPGGCNETGPPSGGGGGGGSSKHHHSSISRVGIPGLVILSVCFIALIAYCVVGMIVMRVKYDQTGTDVIPNKGLWFSLPSLVKDGVLLTVSPCRSACNRRSGYSKM